MKKLISLIIFMALTITLISVNMGNAFCFTSVDGEPVLEDVAVDSGNIVVDSGTVGIAPHSTFSGGTKVVTTAGTGVVLAASTPSKFVVIRALLANTGTIYVGGSDVDKTTQNGVSLEAGQATVSFVDNLADIWIDATVNGEGVGFTNEV